MKSLFQAQLYGILDTAYVPPLLMPAMARKLIAGGIDLLQLRAKQTQQEDIIMMAREILPIAQAANIPFLINDHPHLAALVGAQGVHLGQEDMSVQQARAILGKELIIGLSTHSLEQVHQSIEQQPDYIGFGPLFTTPTKPDYKPIGLENIRAAQELVPFPLFCIGGITLATLPQVMHAGAKRVVMVSALLKDKSPQALTSQIKQKFILNQGAVHDSSQSPSNEQDNPTERDPTFF